VRIAVTGATGNVGRRVVQSLPGHEVAGLSSRNAHYMDLKALRAALAGVDTLVFVSSDGEAVNVMLHHQNVLRAATESGVSHVVLLSSVDADVDSPFCYAVTNGHTERLLLDTGIPYSIARACIYTEFFTGLLGRARSGDTLRLPAGDGRISLVSRLDVAECLAALALQGPTGRAHDLTGEKALHCTEIAALAGYAYEDVPPQEFRASLASQGEDAWWEYAYATMFDSIRQHRWETVTGEVRRLTGKPPAPPRL
jgi:NAD(P)H dehydrogenase (quinone)